MTAAAGITMTELEQLIRIVPPPSQPIEPATPDRWAKAEARLGVRFPPDYQDLCSTYGSGAFAYEEACDVIYNPAAAAYESCVSRSLQAFRTRAEGCAAHEPLPDAVSRVALDGGVLPLGDAEYIFALYYVVGPNAGWELLIEDVLACGAPYGFTRESSTITGWLLERFKWLLAQGAGVRFEAGSLESVREQTGH